jgi:hypothetical protein
MGPLTPLLLIVEIDGEQIPLPKNKMLVEALIQRAGREGFKACTEALATVFGVKGIEQAKN